MSAPEISAPAKPPKMEVNQQHLKQAWDVSQVITRDDWEAWAQRLSVELMKESPSHALRACMSLVEKHHPLARELFNAAFLSCWTELYGLYQVSPSLFKWTTGSHRVTGRLSARHRASDYVCNYFYGASQ